MGVSQSRKHSILETLANVAVGYVVAIAAQILIFPLWGIHEALGSQLGIGSMFTVISICRTYVIRRIANSWRGDACAAAVDAMRKWIEGKK